MYGSFCIDCIGQSWHTSNAPVHNEDAFMRGGGKGGGGGLVTKSRRSFFDFTSHEKQNFIFTIFTNTET
jgi:hypothetical protein